jgi:hypothetical protein
MSVAERKAVSRAKKAGQPVQYPILGQAEEVEPESASTTEPVASERKTYIMSGPSKLSPPPPIGDTLSEHEAFTAALKVRALRPEASGQDVTNYQRALDTLTELRGDSGPDMTEAGWMRSATTKRLQALLTVALKPYPEAMRAAADAFERAGNGQ